MVSAHKVRKAACSCQSRIIVIGSPQGAMQVGGVLRNINLCNYCTSSKRMVLQSRYIENNNCCQVATLIMPQEQAPNVYPKVRFETVYCKT